MATFHIEWAASIDLDLDAGDWIVLRCTTDQGGQVRMPTELDVIHVAFGAETQIVTYAASRPVRFNTAVLFPDPAFEKYRRDLKDFYDYRQRILDSTAGT